MTFVSMFWTFYLLIVTIYPTIKISSYIFDFLSENEMGFCKITSSQINLGFRVYIPVRAIVCVCVRVCVCVCVCV